ncbi:hypothetical protein [Salimicrobium salexigens]|uniref:Acyltransferase n=1 Tax=Salimicrobium salexigens TaxID=908941 RepID=A0ABY1KZ79_9BACI|nr:hypothetical protein [Salimicrobium salexigens]SIS95752.1 hypothetical protein SAMN05421758_1136 [Salimicrobium salexigens]
MDNREKSRDLRAPEKRFRPELEGVRAVAALLVAIYHIWLGSVSGGRRCILYRIRLFDYYFASISDGEIRAH